MGHGHFFGLSALSKPRFAAINGFHSLRAGGLDLQEKMDSRLRGKDIVAGSKTDLPY